ncbi:DUF2577 family protein [Hydrogenoanaerobacterium sp.]|uniref:DUF2577 family protein n=1 Tax=Hydrogenoanaerobacterium sp. TaxID=2953763 RepID=UPI002898A262|nr:DUF2577 family protein [Hydrogenoanaerobacterium sp.]
MASDLATVIKGIVRDYLENESMSDLIYATYTGAGLKIDNKPLPVGLDMVDIPQHLRTITATLSTTLTSGFEIIAKDKDDEPVTVESIKLTNVPVTLQTGLAVGDRVAVVQKRGGQKYTVIDRV